MDKNDTQRVTLAWRYTAWAIFTAVVVMTIWPFNLAPEGPFSIGISRVVSYAALSFAFAMAYPRQFIFATSVPIVCLCAHELLPIFVVNHHLDLPDTVRKVIGIVIGVAAGKGINKRLKFTW